MERKRLLSTVAVRHKSGLFLVSLVGYYLLLPYIGWFGEILPFIDSGSFRVILFMGTLLAGIRAVSGEQTHFRVGLAIGVSTFVIDWLAYFVTSPALHILAHLAYLLFVTYVGIRVFRYVVAPGEVDPDRIFAAISIYFLIGLGFAILYAIFEFIHPGSFSGLSAGGGTSQSAGFLYYSFVTLTTLGYGEIVPHTPQARSLAAVEAMMGVFYLAIMVARLMALYSGSAKR